MSACGRKVIALSSECRRPLTLALANFDAGENFLVPSRCKIRELLRGDMRFADDGAIARLVEPEPQVLFALDVLPGRVSNVATCSIRDARPGLPGEPGFRHGWGGSASPLLDVRPVRKSAHIGKTGLRADPSVGVTSWLGIEGFGRALGRPPSHADWQRSRPGAPLVRRPPPSRRRKRTCIEVLLIKLKIPERCFNIR